MTGVKRWAARAVALVGMGLALAACNMDVRLQGDATVDRGDATADAERAEVDALAPPPDGAPATKQPDEVLPDSCVGEPCASVGPVFSRIGFIVAEDEVLGLAVALDEHRVVASLDHWDPRFGARGPSPLSFRLFRSRQRTRLHAFSDRECRIPSNGDNTLWKSCVMFSSEDRLPLPTDRSLGRFSGNLGAQPALSVGWLRSGTGVALHTRPCQAEGRLYNLNGPAVSESDVPRAEFWVSRNCLGPLIFEAPFEPSPGASLPLLWGLSDRVEPRSEDTEPPKESLRRPGVSAFAFQDRPAAVSRIAWNGEDGPVAVLDESGAIFVRRVTSQFVDPWQFWERVETPADGLPGGGIRQIEALRDGSFVLLTHRARNPPSNNNSLCLRVSTAREFLLDRLCEPGREYDSADHGVVLDIAGHRTLRAFLYEDGTVVSRGTTIASGPGTAQPSPIDAIACARDCNDLLAHTTSGVLLLYSLRQPTPGEAAYELVASTQDSTWRFSAHIASMEDRTEGNERRSGWIVFATSRSPDRSGSSVYFLPTRDASAGPQRNLIVSLQPLGYWQPAGVEFVAANDGILSMRLPHHALPDLWMHYHARLYSTAGRIIP